MRSGRRVPLPSLRLDPQTGSAGQAIPVDLHLVTSIRLVGAARGDVLDAQLPHARADKPTPRGVALSTFCIDELEVTVAQYKSCSDTGD